MPKAALAPGASDRDSLLQEEVANPNVARRASDWDLLLRSEIENPTVALGASGRDSVVHNQISNLAVVAEHSLSRAAPETGIPSFRARSRIPSLRAVPQAEVLFSR